MERFGFLNENPGNRTSATELRLGKARTGGIDRYCAIKITDICHFKFSTFMVSMLLYCIDTCCHLPKAFLAFCRNLSHLLSNMESKDMKGSK